MCRCQQCHYLVRSRVELVLQNGCLCDDVAMWNDSRFRQPCGPTGHCIYRQAVWSAWTVVKWRLQNIFRFNQETLPIAAPFEWCIFLTADEEEIGRGNAAFGGCFNDWLDAARLCEDELGFCECEVPVELGRGVCRIDARNAGSRTDYG